MPVLESGRSDPFQPSEAHKKRQLLFQAARPCTILFVWRDFLDPSPGILELLSAKGLFFIGLFRLQGFVLGSGASWWRRRIPLERKLEVEQVKLHGENQDNLNPEP